MALEVLKEIPEGKVFVIPARLEECDVPEPLQRLQYCELFSDGIPALVAAVRATHAERIGDDRELAKGWMRDELGEAALRKQPFEYHGPILRRVWKGIDLDGALSRRILHNVALKQRSVEVFCDRYLAAFVSAGVKRIFIESGSTMALLGDALAQSIKGFRRGDFSIITNNAATFLDFTFRGLNVTLFPPGEVDPFYGATFGSLSQLKPRPPGTPTDTAEEQLLLTRLKNEITGAAGRIDLVCISSSGLSPHPRNIVEMTVGSYYNLLMKRGLLSLTCPIACFVDGTKWMPPKGRSDYQVFNQALTPADVLAKRPFVLISSFTESEKCDQFASYFEKLEAGTVDISTGTHHLRTVVFANSKFNSSIGVGKPIK